MHPFTTTMTAGATALQLAIGGALAPFSATAGAVYKCIAGGKITYSSTPCGSGQVTTLATGAVHVPDQPTLDRLARQKQLLDEQLAQRAALEQRDDEARLRAEKAEGRQHQKCARQRAASRRADALAERAMGRRKQQLRERASTMRQALAAQCPA